MLRFFKLKAPTNAPASLFMFIKAERNRMPCRAFGEMYNMFLASRRSVLGRVGSHLPTRWKLCKIVSKTYRNLRKFEAAYRRDYEQKLRLQREAKERKREQRRIREERDHLREERQRERISSGVGRGRRCTRCDASDFALDCANNCCGRCCFGNCSRHGS